MRRFIIICSALLTIAGCAQDRVEVKPVEAAPEPTMTEIAESNPS